MVIAHIEHRGRVPVSFTHVFYKTPIVRWIRRIRDKHYSKITTAIANLQKHILSLKPTSGIIICRAAHT